MLRRILFALFVLKASLCSACPSCSDALGNTPQSAGYAKGFYWSILFMLGMVFSLVAVLIVKIVREARKGPAVPPPTV
jgi:hypothetical protein